MIPSRCTVRVSASPSRNELAAPGCVRSSRRARLLQLRLGFIRIGQFARALHGCAHHRPLVLGEILADIAPLVHLAALHECALAPAGPNRAPQRFAPIDDEQTRR